MKKEQCLDAPKEVPERLLKGEYALLLAPAGAAGAAAVAAVAAAQAAAAAGARSGKKREAEVEGEGEQGEPSPVKKVRGQPGREVMGEVTEKEPLHSNSQSICSSPEF